MNISDVQAYFRISDAVDIEKMRQWLHPELKLVTINVGIPGPLGLEEYLEFLQKTKAYHAGLGQHTEHIPHSVRFEGDYVAIRGQLVLKSKSAPDHYSPYMDFWKLRDGKIAEYYIAFDI